MSVVFDLAVVRACVDVTPDGDNKRDLCARLGESFFVLKRTPGEPHAVCVAANGQIGRLPCAALEPVGRGSATPSSAAVRLSINVFASGQWKELLAVELDASTVVRDVHVRVHAAAGSADSGCGVLFGNGAFFPPSSTLADCGLTTHGPHRLKFFDFAPQFAKLHGTPRRLSSSSNNTSSTSTSDSRPPAPSLASSAAPVLTLPPRASFAAPTRPAPILSRSAPPPISDVPEAPALLSPRSVGGLSVPLLPRSSSSDGRVSPRTVHNFEFEILKALTVTPPHGKPYVLYEISFVSRSRRRSAVQRRFSDFFDLHQALSALFPSTTMPKLPSKKLVNTSEIVEKRRLKLRAYLSALPEAALSSSVFRAFLDETDVMSSDDWNELFADVVPMPFDDQTIVLLEDEPNDSMFLLDDGIVTVERASLQLAFLGKVWLLFCAAELRLISFLWHRVTLLARRAHCLARAAPRRRSSPKSRSWFAS